MHRVTLDAYAQRVADVVRAQPEPVVLVGHSMGGIAITQGAEAAPEAIRTLVYLSAWLLPDGIAIVDERDPRSPLPLTKVRIDGADAVTLEADAARARLYSDCSDADAAWAMKRLVPQAYAPLAAPLHLTPARYGRIPRVYIECTADQTIPLAVQRRLYQRVCCREVMTLETGHSPFLSAPADLASCLLQVAGSTGA
jgi:pimeloyl-ACP methyl ester carboxylesterase